MEGGHFKVATCTGGWHPSMRKRSASSHLFWFASPRPSRFILLLRLKGTIMVSEAAETCSWTGGSSPQGCKTLSVPYPIDALDLVSLQSMLHQHPPVDLTWG